MRYSTLFSLLLLVFIDSMGFGLIFPILGPLVLSHDGILAYSATAGTRDLYYVLILVSFAIFMFIATPFIGDLSDRYGRKPLLIYCLIGTAIGAFICAWGIYDKSLLWLVIGRSVSGLTAGSGAVSQAALVDISDETNKTSNFGLMSLAGSVGFAMGPVIGGYFSNPYLVSWFSYWTPFVIDGILAALNALLIYFSYYPIMRNKKQEYAPITIFKPFTLIYEAFNESAISRLSYVLVFYETAWSLYLQYISMFLMQRYHLNSPQIGNFMTAMAIILGLTFIFIIRILLWYLKERFIVLLSLPICALGIFLHLFSHSLLSLYFVMIPLSIAIALVWVALLTLFSDVVSPERQGWSMGVVNAVVSFSWIFGGVFTGSLDYLYFQAPFIVAGILLLISFINMVKEYRFNCE